jgi:RNA polymerase sigma-70 factor (ECF subfamily)
VTVDTHAFTRSPSVDDLLGQVATGDMHAFGTLYSMTSARMYGLIRRVLIDFSQAEEVTQEGYLEVWQLAGRYNPATGSGTAWMFTIGHRRAIDRVRASQSSRARDLKIGIRDLPDPIDEVPSKVETALEFERATRCLEFLTAIQREALTLVYWDGFTASELAEQLGVNIWTAKSRIHSGLFRLRIAMESDTPANFPEQIPR